MTSTDEPLSRWCLRLLVLVPVLCNAVWLVPELATVPSRNDSALHLLLVHAASDALREGAHPLDFWIPQLELGFPQFLYYQHLPHLDVVAIHRLLFGLASLDAVYHAVQYALLVGFPLTVAWSMRHMGFSLPAAAMSAAAASLLSASARYGFEYNSYLWRGVGLYTQLWGMHLSFVALACLVRTVRDGTGYVGTALALAALALSHFVYAYMMGISSVLVWLVGADRRSLLPRGTRLAVVGTLAVALVGYMLWPVVESSRDWLNNLPGLVDGPPSSAGDRWGSALRGRLLDAQRWPVLTALTGLGLLAVLLRRSQPGRLAGVGLVVWAVLYLGRPSLGALGDLLPAHSGFITFRFVGAVELFVILVIGLAGEWVWDRLAGLGPPAARWRPVVATLCCAAPLLPALLERRSWYAGNRQVIDETRTALAADTALAQLLTTIEQRVAQETGGRTYAGRRNTWSRSMMVGPSLTAADVVNARRLPAIGNPLQGLALNSGLLFSFREADAALYDVYDVRHVLTPAGASVPAFFQPVQQAGAYQLWQVPTSGPAMFVQVTDRQRARSQRELYEGMSAWYTSAAPAARQVTRWDYRQPAGPAAPRAACPAGTITAPRVRSQHVQVTVECPTDAAVAFKQTFHPQWRVAIDGTLASPYMVSPGFLAVDVPAGRHRVDAFYVAHRARTPLFVAGLVILALAVGYRQRLDGPARWVAVRLPRP